MVVLELHGDAAWCCEETCLGGCTCFLGVTCFPYPNLYMSRKGPVVVKGKLDFVEDLIQDVNPH